MNDLPQGNYPRDTGSFPWFMSVLAAILLLLLGLPIVALFLRALSVIAEHPIMIFSQPVIAAATLSLGTTAVSVLIVVAVGTPAAYVFARYEFPFKSILNFLIELPIVMPPVVAGLALLMAFGRRGLLGPPLALLGIELPFSSAAVVIAQVFVASPFYIRAAQARFASIPYEIEEAASIDGAGSWRILTDVSIPLSLPSLSIGLVLSWARALGEFGATIFCWQSTGPHADNASSRLWGFGARYTGCDLGRHCPHWSCGCCPHQYALACARSQQRWGRSSFLLLRWSESCPEWIVRYSVVLLHRVQWSTIPEWKSCPLIRGGFAAEWPQSQL